MSARHVDHLLIGGGVASATCAATLREEGAAGSVLVVGRELDPPSHRPPITKGILRGTSSRQDALVHPAGWWAQHDVELLTRTTVTALDPAARTVALSTGETVGYGTALVATGGTVRRLDVEGADLDGVHYLRTPGNAESLRRDLAGAERVVCVGGSYIGCEVAASLTAMGLHCTILMLEQEPLERHFGATVGRFFRGALEARGVEVLGGVEVSAFTGADDLVTGVALADGRTVAADVVVCGIGAIPDVALARRAGLTIGSGGGVRCDNVLRTSAPGVFAAGDVCEYDSVVHGRTLRVEHEDVAAAQGAAVARGMLGATAPYDVVPHFWSELADWTALRSVGPAAGWDQEVVRGTIDDGAFSVFYLAGGRVQAALAVGGGDDDLERGRALIASDEAVGAGGL